jgi:hypothetical protein
MAHSLVPTESTPRRSLDEILELLRGEFPVFDADRKRGDDIISEMIACWLRMKRTRESWNKPGDTNGLDSMIEHWSAIQGNAAFVVVADVDNDEDRSIAFNLVPGEEILIGYANAKHEESSEPLTKRVAQTLGYDGDFD